MNSWCAAIASACSSLYTHNYAHIMQLRVVLGNHVCLAGNHKKDVIGAGVGSATALLLVALVVILVVVGYKCRSRFRRKLSGEMQEYACDHHACIVLGSYDRITQILIQSGME